jgi:hypothetical protein
MHDKLHQNIEVHGLWWTQQFLRHYHGRLAPRANPDCLGIAGRGRGAHHQQGEEIMPEKQTLERARPNRRQGKSPSVQAGEFVREEIHHVREGKHGARSAKQAIAIGLSKARRAGVDLPPPARDKASEPTGKSAQRDYEAGQGQITSRSPSARRSRASERALRREGRSAASPQALSRQAKCAAQRRYSGKHS